MAVKGAKLEFMGKKELPWASVALSELVELRSEREDSVAAISNFVLY